MRILLIWPKGFDTKFTIPLALAYLKSSLANTPHEVEILDCALLGLDSTSSYLRETLRDFRPHVVGLSSWSQTFPEAVAVCRVAKSVDPGICTVLGGVHATVYPQHAIEETTLDFVMVGEAEKSFPAFIEELDTGMRRWAQVPGLAFRDPSGAVQRNPFRLEEDLDSIRMPDYEAINLQGYVANGYRYLTGAKWNAPLWATRGCPYGCRFCSALALNGSKVRTHSVQYLMSIVRQLYNEHRIRFINIIDDNFTFHSESAKAFCRAVIDAGFKGLSFATPNGIRIERMDPELLMLMKKAGWHYLTVAPESGSQRTLKLMGKKLDLNIVPEKIRQIRAAGLKVHGFFIIGYPGEEKEDIDRTIRLLRSCRFNYFSLAKFQPLPGTPVYQDLVNDGHIDGGWLPLDYYSTNGYTPSNLQNIDFGRMIMVEHIHLALTNPLNLPYHVRMFNPSRIASRLAYRLLGR